MFRIRLPLGSSPGALRRSGGPRRRILRLLLPLSVVALVGLLALVLHQYVAVTERFEGRLWKLPARIYSDALVLGPGDRVNLDALARRLDRSGYARTEHRPERPGQYRRRRGSLEVHARPFAAAGVESAGGWAQIRASAGYVAGLTDAGNRPLGEATFEPELLATLYGERQEERQIVRLEQVPETFVRAVLAAEDARFFDHEGIDLRGILRAAWANLRERRIVQGGSTITQQTVKNLFLHQRRTWWRKLREASMALMLDARYPKRRILEVYLNEVYMGQRGPVAICGVQAAARFYFGRDLAELSLAESALIAGLIRSPGHYNPFVHPERARDRRDVVLGAMERLGLAPAEQILSARQEKPALASGSGGFAGAPHAVDFVRSQLAVLYPPQILLEEGLRVFTTLDTGWQEHAEAALREGLERLERERPTPAGQRDQRTLQGAVLVTRPDSGAVLALVGGRDYRESQFNRAVQARRQPGSCFKPFVFAAGLERTVRGQRDGLTPATLLEDAPLHMTSGGKAWSPENYDRSFRGWVTVRQALEESLNVPTVRAAQQVGLERTIELARACGIVSPLQAVPSLALGAKEITPLELATAYGTLARMGTRVDPWIVREVVDRDGRSLARRVLREGTAVSPQTAFLVNDMLRGVLDRGTARSARALGYRGTAAGKTGTTDDTRDSWFVGYTPQLLALVWVGYDDNARTGLTGATGALPIWVDLMGRAGDPYREPSFPQPEGIVFRRIDPESGALATDRCPSSYPEVFVDGSEPYWLCRLHRGGFRRFFDRVFGSP